MFAIVTVYMALINIYEWIYSAHDVALDCIQRSTTVHMSIWEKFTSLDMS